MYMCRTNPRGLPDYRDVMVDESAAPCERGLRRCPQAVCAEVSSTLVNLRMPAVCKREKCRTNASKAGPVPRQSWPELPKDPSCRSY